MSIWIRRCLWLALAFSAWPARAAAQVDAPEITALCCAPDGKTVFAACLDGRIRVHDLDTGKERSAFLAHKEGAWSAFCCPHGQVLVTGGGDKLVRAWDAKTFKLLATFEGSSQAVLSIAVSADGKTLAAGGGDGVLSTWDFATGKRKTFWRAHELRVLSLSFSPDGNILASGGTCSVDSANVFRGVAHADQVRLWDPVTGKEIRKLTTHGSMVAYAPDGRSIASAGYYVVAQQRENAVARAYLRAETRSAIALTFHDADVLAIKDAGAILSLSRDGRLLALAYGSRRYFGSDRYIPESSSTSVTLWETATGKQIREVAQLDATALAISPDSRKLVVAVPFVGLRILDLSPKFMPSDEELTLEKLWIELASPEPADAYRAMARLAAQGEKAVVFLGRHLGPVQPPTVDVPALLAKLDSDKYAVREAAFRDLKKLGTTVEGELRKSLQDLKASAEFRQRATKLLEKMQKRPGTSEELQQLRALQVLAAMGTPSANALIEQIAQGAPGAWWTLQAQIMRECWVKR